jgi:NADH:ubiquinone oxidoreductase subunit F (NADH-binding)
MPEKVLLRHEDVPNLRRLDVYEGDSGYQAARRALTENQPAQIIELVKSRGCAAAAAPVFRPV